jgi:hypothetical protein
MTPELEACLGRAFALIGGAVTDRRHAFHTPTLATVAPDGAPEARTVVLRGFDASARSLRAHADARSGKVTSLLRESRCAVHLYDAAGRVQIRLAGRAAVHGDDAVADVAWAESRDASRMVYAVEPGPGSAVAAPLPAPRDAAAGRVHFRVVVLRFDLLDWLELHASGHHRARFGWDAAGGCTAGWVMP